MSEPIPATDGERDVALALLREASPHRVALRVPRWYGVDGRLTVEDLAERAEMVHVARTRDDLAAATALRSVSVRSQGQ